MEIYEGMQNIIYEDYIVENTLNTQGKEILGFILTCYTKYNNCISGL